MYISKAPTTSTLASYSKNKLLMNGSSFVIQNTERKLIHHKVLLLTNSTFQSLFVYLLCLSLVFETVFIPLINIGLQSTKKKSSFFNNMLMEFFLHIQTISRNIQNLNSMLFLWINEVCLLIYMYLGSNSFATRLALFHSSAAINMSMASLIRSTFR